MGVVSFRSADATNKAEAYVNKRPLPAAAATFGVNTTNDTNDASPGNTICADNSGNCSLRAAIQESNALGGSHILILNAGTYNLNSEIPVTADVTILGLSTLSRIIDGQNFTRLFNVQNGARLLINQATLRDGYTGSGDGGAIYNRGILALQMVRLENNRAAGSSTASARGGAIYSNNSLTIDSSSFYTNTASLIGFGSTTDAFGGAIYGSGFGSTIDITNSYFQGNLAAVQQADGAVGGALYLGWGTMNINGSTFIDNKVQNIQPVTTGLSAGGAIGASILGATTIVDTIFSNNETTGFASASQRGGAIYNLGNMNISGNTCTFSDNVTIGDGGAIYNNNILNVSCGFQTNSANNRGGAIYSAGSTTLTNSTLSSNSSGTGGGGAIYFGADNGIDLFTIDSVSFNGNSTTGSGGAIVNIGPGSMGILQSSFSLNVANNVRGGAIFNSAALGINLTDFVANSALLGGAISGSGTVTIDATTIASNSATQDGGGIEITGGTFTITNSIINDNASNQYGGGIYMSGGVGNNLTNSTLSANRANDNGGGLYVNSSQPMYLNNVTISGNSADFDGNESGDGGGVWGGDILMQNSILAANFDNSPTNVEADCSGVIDSAGYNLIGWDVGCLLTGDLTGNQMGLTQALDPQLAPLTTGIYATAYHDLLPYSPAYAKGDPAGCTTHLGNLLFSDQRGEARPQSGRCDIGAIELICAQAAPLLPNLLLTESGNDINLSWSNEVSNSTHEVWYSDTPYATPPDLGSMLIETSGFSHTHTNILAGPNDLHFYTVWGENGCGMHSFAQEWQGYVRFMMTPGS